MAGSRRSFLGSAALAAGGLLSMARAAVAETGFGRNSALPPGVKAGVPEVTDAKALPDFRYALDKSTPILSLIHI